MNMAAESLEVRMAHLEGAYAQIDKRLGAVETALRDLRVELLGEIGRVRDGMGGLRGEMGGLRGHFGGEVGSLRQEIRDLRGDVRPQFYWVIGLIVVTLLVPIALRFLPP